MVNNLAVSHLPLNSVVERLSLLHKKCLDIEPNVESISFKISFTYSPNLDVHNTTMHHVCDSGFQ